MAQRETTVKFNQILPYIVFLATATAATVAHAAGAIDGQVSFGWGTLIADVLREQAGPMAIAVVGAIVHFLPGGTGSLIRMLRVDQLLEKAVNAGINKTAGAVDGKVLTVKVGNEVIERALEYAASQAPGLFKKLPINEWREKIIARLKFGADVSADNLAQGYVNASRGG
jgi:hypothetical protein